MEFNMYRLPFFIGNFLACFVPGPERRHRVRGYTNIILYYIPIVFFIRRVYGERVKKISFVRQITLNRMTCIVNDKYYVKVFRNVSVEKLNNYKFLLNLVRPKLKINIPVIHVAKHIAMYACEKLPGKSIYAFKRKDVLKHEDKIQKQVFDVIKTIQKIPFNSIMNNERFKFSMQPQRTKEKPYHKDVAVLAHFDLNEGNLLLDRNYNIKSIIDWDSLSMAKNPNTDKEIFLKHWARYKIQPMPD